METMLSRFYKGACITLWRLFGAHIVPGGTRFRVWAPGAKAVYVTGSFCQWDPNAYPLLEYMPGIWEGIVKGALDGDLYKYVIDTAEGQRLFKADPVAFFSEKPPGTASVIAKLRGYRWHDASWRKNRGRVPAPISIYEVHLASWRKPTDGEYPSWRTLSETLIPYAADMGYSHIELMPITEHPYDGSWGYQTTGYFAPSARFGTPTEFMAFVDACHQAGLGVILDWVPGHFCRDAHGLGRFTGAPLYEGADHQQWGTYKFDFSRGEVRSFLISSALYWLHVYHIDGLRVDGVTSMLYLNFGVFTEDAKRPGDVDEDAITFLRELNTHITWSFPDVMTFAEESTDWPHVTGKEGLGFTYKWDMGWMNDTLHYMALPFDQRACWHRLLNFSMLYAFSERFLLPLSHDEVVHGKRSLIGRMPGDQTRQFQGLRLLLLYQFCHPGPKLCFMGDEIAQYAEWDEAKGVEWFLLDYENHRDHQAFVQALNRFYRAEKSLWADEGDWYGFQWLNADDAQRSVLSFLRRGEGEVSLVLLNFSEQTWEYTVTPPDRGRYRLAFATEPGEGEYRTKRDGTLTLTLAPLGGYVYKKEVKRGEKRNSSHAPGRRTGKPPRRADKKGG